MDMFQNLCQSIQISENILTVTANLAADVIRRNHIKTIFHSAQMARKKAAEQVLVLENWKHSLTLTHLETSIAIFIHRSICETTIFDNDGISNAQTRQLIDYEKKLAFHELELDVMIPTAPSFPGDSGFLDIGKLMNGEPANFKVPQNVKWL